VSLARSLWLPGLLAVLVPGCAARHTSVLGRSVQRRPIAAVELRAPHPRAAVLVVGWIHGNEPAGIAIARALRHAGPTPAIDLWVIDDLNPDAVAAATRQSAHRIDLNRNFPWR
jgi:murein peptide amidase A